MESVPKHLIPTHPELLDQVELANKAVAPLIPTES